QVEAIRRADEVDRLAAADADLITPAMSLIGTCRRLRIALRLDPDGRLVLGRSDLHGKEPEIPPSLAWQLKFMPARLPNCSEPMNRPFEVKNKMAP
ncbi:MAG TPA: hypothetical protein VJ728_05405, partial [Candidatus Binataceae bacterium]|nr:hypothetical protein [Candidatus Binataceae bacterium]